MSEQLEALFTKGLPKPFGIIWGAIRFKEIQKLGNLFEELPKFIHGLLLADICSYNNGWKQIHDKFNDPDSKLLSIKKFKNGLNFSEWWSVVFQEIDILNKIQSSSSFPPPTPSLFEPFLSHKSSIENIKSHVETLRKIRNFATHNQGETEYTDEEKDQILSTCTLLLEQFAWLREYRFFVVHNKTSHKSKPKESELKVYFMEPEAKPDVFELKGSHHEYMEDHGTYISHHKYGLLRLDPYIKYDKKQFFCFSQIRDDNNYLIQKPFYEKLDKDECFEIDFLDFLNQYGKQYKDEVCAPLLKTPKQSSLILRLPPNIRQKSTHKPQPHPYGFERLEVEQVSKTDGSIYLLPQINSTKSSSLVTVLHEEQTLTNLLREKLIEKNLTDFVQPWEITLDKDPFDIPVLHVTELYSYPLEDRPKDWDLKLWKQFYTSCITAISKLHTENIYFRNYAPSTIGYKSQVSILCWCHFMTNDIHANPPVKSLLDVPYTKLSSDQIDRFQLAISLANQNPSPDLTPEVLRHSVTTTLKKIKLSSSTANRCLELNLALKLLQWDELHDLTDILPFIETFEIPTDGIPSTQQTAWIHLGHFLSRQLNTLNSEIRLTSTPNALIQQLPAFEHLPLDKISLQNFNHNWGNLEKIFIEMNWRQLWERGIIQRKHLYALAKRTQHSTLQERYLSDRLYLPTRPSLQQIRRWECDLSVPRTPREPPSLLKLIEAHIREHSPLIDTELGHSKVSEYLTQHSTLEWKHLYKLIVLGSEQGRWYQSRQIPKKIRKPHIISYHRDGNIQSKRMRRLNIPNPVLKRIQSIILKCLDPVFPSNEYSTGFTRNQSVVTHALYHSGATAAVKMDIHSFFLSTGFTHLPSSFEDTLSKHFSDQDLFKRLIPLCYYIPKPKRELHKEMTHWNFLSEGAPTSPFFSNLSASEMDDLLGRITKTLGFTYSRYADDLVISTNESIPRVGFQNVAQNILSFAIETGGRMNTIREVCPKFEEYLLSFYDLWGFFSDGHEPELDTVNFKSVLREIQCLKASTPNWSISGWKVAREKTHVWHHQHGRPLCICGIVVPSHKSDPLSLPKEYRREIRAILHRLKTKSLASNKEDEEKVKLSNHGKLAYAAHVYGTSHLLPLVKPFFARQLEQCLQSIVPMRAIPFVQQGWTEGIKKTKD